MFMAWPDPLQTWPPQLARHSSPAGRFSSIRLMNFIRISVTLSPLRVSWTNLTSTAIWTWNTHTHFQESTLSPWTWTQPGTFEWWRWAHHLQGSSEDATEQVGVDQCVVVIRQLHKVHQRVVLQDEREFVPGGAPVGHAGGDSQVHLEGILPSPTTRRARKWTENHAGGKQWLKGLELRAKCEGLKASWVGREQQKLTFAITSAVSRKSWQRPTLERARKSSIRRTPML